MEDTNLKLQVGDALQLQFVDDDTKDRVYVKVIGYLDGQSVVVTNPRINGNIMLIREGQGFIVRLLSGNRVLGFNSTVMRTCARPYAYLHLSYPNDTQEMVVRRAQRATVDIIVSVQNKHPERATDKAVSAVIRDMSTAGCLITSRSLLGEEDDILDLSARVNVGNVEDYLRLPASIKNVRHEPDATNHNGDPYRYGIEFQLVEGHDSLMLHGFVYEQIAKNLLDT